MDLNIDFVDHVLPSSQELTRARTSLVESLPSKGIGAEAVEKHLQENIVPGLTRPNKSPNYYGFVTGSVTPAAAKGDRIVSENDQNVCVHLPEESIATEVEDRALTMLCELLDLQPDEWLHRTFSTGATASNVLGLACGREFVIHEAAVFNDKDISVAEHGIHEAMRLAGIESVQILTTMPHSSLRKAASIVGLGHNNIKDVGLLEAPHRFDMQALKTALSQPKLASIVAISCGEVNTGFFATNRAEMDQIRNLCDQFGAWLHIDAAFGLLATLLPQSNDYAKLREGVAGLELADSITGDAHKLLNVPYDCGIFLSRHLSQGQRVFQNPGAVYLQTTASSIPSPLNLGLENSRRFRALPVYASFLAYGADGYRDMIIRQVELARGIAKYIAESEKYELLPDGNEVGNVYIIVLFRAKDEALNKNLVKRVNSSRRIYVSGTQWDGRPAARFAVASWMVSYARDIEIIRQVLDEVAR
jgi:glutamate/tyrosine decarboxylase-like PLP-dependent enzyme